MTDKTECTGGFKNIAPDCVPSSGGHLIPSPNCEPTPEYIIEARTMAASVFNGMIDRQQNEFITEFIKTLKRLRLEELEELKNQNDKKAEQLAELQERLKLSLDY